MKDREKNFLKISLNTKIYPPEAIYGASYVFIDKAYIYLDQKKKDIIEVYFKSKNSLSNKQTEALKGEFKNELLHYVVRINLLKYNKKIRERLIERALFSGIKDEKSGEGDFSLDDDPLGIAVPWDEKFGDDEKKSKKNKKIIK